MFGSQRLVLFTLMVTTLAACDGRMIAAGNVMLATVPMALLWVTVNLKKSR